MVKEKTERGIVFIVGGGPSLSGFDFKRLINRDSISINQSIFQVPNSKYFVTMDYTWLLKSGVYRGQSDGNARRQFISSKAHKVFVIGFKEPRLVIDGERFIDTEMKLTYDLSLFDVIIRASSYGGISTSSLDFRCGSDSGYSAIQLAVILGYSEVFLLGFDFTFQGNETHWHDAYPPRKNHNYQKKLNEFLIPYPQAFDDLNRIKTCKVYSCSKISKLNQYAQYVDINGVL